ncbi:MAG: hypothetical protein AAF408_02405 [Pseudomonadota bacterium]
MTETRDDIARIAAEVSQLMQLDRMRHHVGSHADLEAQANIPAYLASVFQTAGAIAGPMSNEELYDLINRRIAGIEAQLYLMRVELENRAGRDPAAIFTDPMAISAYGERVAALTAQPRSYGFEPAVLAHGWHPTEVSDKHIHRWMRPADGPALACLPHLGAIDQQLEIEGRALHAEQLDGMSIRVAGRTAEIDRAPDEQTRFTARVALKADELTGANYVAAEFDMTDFRQPNELDNRLLGINVSRFSFRPADRED